MLARAAHVNRTRFDTNRRLARIRCALALQCWVIAAFPLLPPDPEGLRLSPLAVARVLLRARAEALAMSAALESTVCSLRTDARKSMRRDKYAWQDGVIARIEGACKS
eukprot:8812362-Alexandrium_andersonii.AAC.1